MLTKTFIEYSNDIYNICKNLEEYNPNKKRKLLVIFDDMITICLVIKTLNPVVTDLFIRVRILLFFSNNLILLYQKLLDQILCTILL